MNRKKKVINNLRGFNISDILSHFTAGLDDLFPKKIALRISLIYLFIGALWILASDKLLRYFVVNTQLASDISMVKGWFYVLVTAGMLYFLIKMSFSKIQSVNKELLKKYKELAAVYEELTASEQELQKQIEMLTDSEERYRLISEATNDGIWDEKHGERNFSERWFEITGYNKEEVVELNDWLSLIHPEDLPQIIQRYQENKKNQDPNYRCEYRLRHKDGRYLWIQSRARLLFDDKGEIIRSAGSHTDITDLKIYEEQLNRLAYEDYLTNLPNRTAFYQSVQRHLNNWPERNAALMFIDIDNFKYINDTLGHVSGDRLISSIGKRLLDLLDSSKSIYRIGGDEFIVFVHQYKDNEEIEACAEAIMQSFEIPFKISDSVMNITVSLGIALYPLHGNDVDTLLKCADMAMYKAKSTNHGRYAFYNQDMDMQVQERMALENELHKALERNEFSLSYQPQMDVTTGQVNSIEALLRWNNAKLGSVSPMKFIGIAEETNLINPIGDWVLLKACEFLKKLHMQGYPEISVSVNVSIIQLMQQDYTEKVMKILSQTGIEPGYVELEITESILIESYDEVKNKLEELNAKGIKIALDDFGTGYSSLSYLTRIPINTLKIDKIFIDTITCDIDERALISMIIMIGYGLGMTIVAEGVETESQLSYLEKHKCHKIQGYYFSKPLPQEELLQLLNKNKALPET